MSHATYFISSMLAIIHTVLRNQKGIQIFCWTLLSLLVSNEGYCQSDASVDLISGRAQIYIPIATLSYGGISVPVGISHHGGAIRVTESEGDFGMGWSLIGGGQVSRLVRGLPDDYTSTDPTDLRRGWLYDNNSSYINSFSPPADDLNGCVGESTAFNFINSLGYVKDSEPDLFFIQAPGLSAQFVFGTDGLPKLTTFQDIKITVNRANGNGAILSISVKNNSGVTYVFNLVSTATKKIQRWKNFGTPTYFLSEYNYYKNSLTYNAAWSLATISSTMSNGVAQFTYRPRTEKGNDFVTVIERPSTANVIDTTYLVNSEFEYKTLEQVSLGSYILTIRNGSDQITIEETQSGEQKVFTFDYFQGRTKIDENRVGLYRKFLRSIKQESNCSPLPSYTFSYQDINYSVPLIYEPWQSELSQDYWGFPANNAGNKNVPSVYFYQNSSGAARFRLPPTAATGNTATDYLGDNRLPSGTTFGALTSIEYPTGGVTNIAYESNTYLDAPTGLVMAGGGLRVKSITTSGGEMAYARSSRTVNKTTSIFKEYVYTLANGSTSGELTYPLSFAFANGNSIVRSHNTLGPEAEVLYSRVTEKVAPFGSTVYEFDLPAMADDENITNWNATRSKIARETCTAIGNILPGAYTYPFAPNPNFDFERGLLRKVTKLSETGAMVSQRVLNYARIPNTVNLVKGLRFERVGNAFHYGHYTINTGISNLLTQEVITNVSQLDVADQRVTTINYSYNPQNQLLQEAQTVQADGSSKRQVYRYAFHYPVVTEVGSEALALKIFNQINAYAAPVETMTYYTPPGQTEILQNASLTTYNGMLPHKTYSFPSGKPFTPSSLSGTTTQSFTFDTDYVLTSTVDSYDLAGRVTQVTDNAKNTTSQQFVANQDEPAQVSIANAKLKNVIAENFEFNSASTLILDSNPINYLQGWTGAKSIQLNTGQNLVINSSNNIGFEKGNNTYRFSCWAKGTASATITYRVLNNSDGLLTTGTVTYANNPSDKWAYLEGTISMAAVNVPFTLRVYSSATVAIDDILFAPINAVVSRQTYKPLTGITSVTDPRGNSATYTYDDAGRKINTFDRKRNLVELNEYKFQKDPTQTLKYGFSSSTSEPLVNSPVTFTALTNCISQVAYTWKVIKPDNTSVTFSGATLVYTFAQPGLYNVMLIVSHPDPIYQPGGYSQKFCVQAALGSFTLTSPSPTVTNCNDNVRVFNVPVASIQACNSAYTVSWEYTNPAGLFIPFNTANSQTLQISLQLSYSYYVRCSISATCGQANIPACGNSSDQTTVRTSPLYTWSTQGPCQ